MSSLYNQDVQEITVGPSTEERSGHGIRSPPTSRDNESESESEESLNQSIARKEQPRRRHARPKGNDKRCSHSNMSGSDWTKEEPPERVEINRNTTQDRREETDDGRD